MRRNKNPLINAGVRSLADDQQSLHRDAMSQAGNRERGPSPSRVSRTALATAAHIPVLLFLATMIASVLLIPEETVQVGRRGGPYIRVPKLPVQIAALTVAAPLAGVVVARLVRGAYLLWALRHEKSRNLALIPGEIIAWRGKQGWRGIDKTRLVMALLACIGPALYIWWLTHIWAGTDLFVKQLFWTFAATVLLGATVTPLVSEPGRTFFNDIFGVMLVTDRRIVWCSPRGNLYRALLGTDIKDAALVEGDELRAWIALVHISQGTVSEINLFGVPDASEALRAIQNIVLHPQT